MWSTANNIELLIITIVLSLFFIACLILVLQLIKLMAKIRRLSDKAETVIDSVESAARTVKNFSEASRERMPLVSLVHKLFEMSSKDKSK